MQSESRDHDSQCSGNDISPDRSAWGRLSQMPELLSLIFLFCLPSHTTMPSENAAPMLLTRVCRSWRSLALSTPQLWSRLRLKTQYEMRDEAELLEKLRKYSMMLRTYLSRVGTVHLSLDIDLLEALYDTHAMEEVTNNRFVSAMVSQMLPFSQQWRHLSLAAPLQYLLPVMSFVNHGQVSQLETLLLDFSCETAFPNFGSDEGELRPFRTLVDVSRAQRLSALTIYGNCDDTVIIRWNPVKLPSTLCSVMLWNVSLDCKPKHDDGFSNALVVNSLRKLYLSASISSSDILSILESSPALEDVTLDLQFPEGGHNGRSNRILRLQNLERLRISVGESTSVLLDTLCLPSLARLEFTTEDSPGLLPRLCRLLQRSEASLKFFLLFDGLGNVREGELLELLQLAKSLRELRILKYGLSDQILLALTLKHDGFLPGGQEIGRKDIHQNSSYTDVRTVPTSLCPNLISITFSARSCFSPQAVIDLLQSRRSTRYCRTEGVQPSQPLVALSSGSCPTLSAIHTHDCPSIADLDTQVASRTTARAANLKTFQAVMERCDVVTENDAVKQSIDHGLELYLREAKQFDPVFE